MTVRTAFAILKNGESLLSMLFTKYYTCVIIIYCMVMYVKKGGTVI